MSDKHIDLLSGWEALVAQQASMDQAYKNVKRQFAAYIRDSSIPLSERWWFFCNANDALKEWDSFIPRTPLMRQYIDDHRPEWRSGSYLWSEIINENYLSDPSDPEQTTFFYEGMELSRIQELSALMEEILARNVRGYTYDW